MEQFKTLQSVCILFFNSSAHAGEHFHCYQVELDLVENYYYDLNQWALTHFLIKVFDIPSVWWRHENCHFCVWTEAMLQKRSQSFEIHFYFSVQWSKWSFAVVREPHINQNRTKKCYKVLKFFLSLYKILVLMQLIACCLLVCSSQLFLYQLRQLTLGHLAVSAHSSESTV